MKMEAETGLLGAKAIRMAMAVKIQELGSATRRRRLSVVAEATVDVKVVAGLKAVAVMGENYAACIVKTPTLTPDI